MNTVTPTHLGGRNGNGVTWKIVIQEEYTFLLRYHSPLFIFSLYLQQRKKQQQLISQPLPTLFQNKTEHKVAQVAQGGRRICRAVFSQRKLSEYSSAFHGDKWWLCLHYGLRDCKFSEPPVSPRQILIEWFTAFTKGVNQLEFGKSLQIRLFETNVARASSNALWFHMEQNTSNNALWIYMAKMLERGELN